MEDFTLTAVDNGLDAVANRAKELRPDVVLADCMMPGKNGYEVCEMLKTDPSTAHIPVMLLAGTFEPFDAAPRPGGGANGHIPKPFDSTSFLDRVRASVGMAAAAAVPTMGLHGSRFRSRHFRSQAPQLRPMAGTPPMRPAPSQPRPQGMAPAVRSDGHPAAPPGSRMFQERLQGCRASDGRHAAARCPMGLARCRGHSHGHAARHAAGPPGYARDGHAPARHAAATDGASMGQADGQAGHADARPPGHADGQGMGQPGMPRRAVRWGMSPGMPRAWRCLRPAWDGAGR